MGPTAGPAQLFFRTAYASGQTRLRFQSKMRMDGSAGNRAFVMVSPDEMRLFALECLRWSDETDNASHRSLMIQVAKTWMATASALERRVDNGDEIFLDMRKKLD